MHNFTSGIGGTPESSGEHTLRNAALEGMVNGKKGHGRRRGYQMIDNIMINGLYEDTKRKAGKRVVECRMLSSQ